jgi:ATP-dependent helicase HrpA
MDEGRQLAAGRNLAAIKAELGVKARGAFAQLAQLSQQSQNESKIAFADKNEEKGQIPGIKSSVSAINSVANDSAISLEADARYMAWTFGELPELLEIHRKLGKEVQILIGFPALIDQSDAVTIEVFDEPDVAAAKHRQGLRRLVALQIKDALKYLEKNIPDLQKMSVAYMSLGTTDELKAQLISCRSTAY